MKSKFSTISLSGAILLLLINSGFFRPGLFAQRLERDVLPASQSIVLNIDANELDYWGTTEIKIRVVNAVDSFSLHAQEAEIRKSELMGADGAIEHAFARRDHGILRIIPSRRLTAGEYTLSFTFAHEFNLQANSLYRVQAGGDGYIFTQFESKGARQAFPCWDEPSFKIPYQITLKVPSKHHAVSNTPIEKESVEGEIKTVVFKQTKPLPSYLLAIATGPLDTVSIPGMSIPGRVISVKGQINMTAEAIKTTPPILQALEKYFGRPYPYEKLDLIAVPEFWAGAMENAGAITCRDEILLIDPNAITVSHKRALAETLAHELAHQWFGDLVTLAWWDDTWLNESFASWMGSKITNEVFPEYEGALADVRGASYAMSFDAKSSADPIHRDIVSDDDIELAFDGITYAKGQAVLEMFEKWIGTDTFRTGIREYIRGHEWGNAVSADLWKALVAASGKNVDRVMTTFVEQAGVPLLTVAVLDKASVKLSQRRFANYGVKMASSQWSIPVNIKYSDGETVYAKSLLLADTSQTIGLDNKKLLVWINLNADASGYYRWTLSPKMLNYLARNGQKILNDRERISFLSNLTALLYAGEVKGDEFLEIVGQFRDDPQPEVTKAIMNALGLVKNVFIDEKLEQPYSVFVQHALGPSLARIGLSKSPHESEADALLRSQLMDMLGDEGKDGRVLAFADSVASLYLTNPLSVDPSFPNVVVRLNAISGDQALFDEYRKRFEQAATTDERQRFLGALGNFRNPGFKEQALSYASNGPLRPTELGDIPFTIASVSQENAEMVFQWMMNNYDNITKKIPRDFLGFLPFFASGCSLQRLKAAKAFFSQPEHATPGTAKNLSKVADTVTDCVTLREREGGAIANYLNHFSTAGK